MCTIFKMCYIEFNVTFLWQMSHRMEYSSKFLGWKLYSDHATVTCLTPLQSTYEQTINIRLQLLFYIRFNSFCCKVISVARNCLVNCIQVLISVHTIFSQLLASGLCQNAKVSDKNSILGFTLSDIKKELHRGSRLVCSLVRLQALYVSKFW